MACVKYGLFRVHWKSDICRANKCLLRGAFAVSIKRRAGEIELEMMARAGFPLAAVVFCGEVAQLRRRWRAEISASRSGGQSSSAMSMYNNRFSATRGRGDDDESRGRRNLSVDAGGRPIGGVPVAIDGAHHR